MDSKADMGAQLDQMSKQYGAAWPDVFGSLVRIGHLPAGYQALAIMDNPSQTVDRVDMQRALSTVAEKKGLAALRESVPPDAAKAIDKGLDDKLADFRATVADDQHAVKLYDTFRDSVRTLAYYRAMRGDSDALESAYQGVLGKRYDFDGTIRVPKGQLYDAQQATRQAVSALKADDLPVLADSTPGLTDADKQSAYLRSIQSRGSWVPMSDDGGLQLIVRTRDNVPRAVTRKDGSPVSVRFDSMTYAGPTEEQVQRTQSAFSMGVQ